MGAAAARSYVAAQQKHSTANRETELPYPPPPLNATLQNEYLLADELIREKDARTKFCTYWSQAVAVVGYLEGCNSLGMFSLCAAAAAAHACK